MVGPEIGLRLDGTDLLLGVNVAKDVAIAGQNITANGVFDYYLVDQVTYWVIELAALYNLAAQSAFSPYVGGGLAIWNWSYDSELFDGFGSDFSTSGTTLVAKGGANFAPMGSVTPFAEASFIFDGSDIALKAGFRVAIGGDK